VINDYINMLQQANKKIAELEKIVKKLTDGVSHYHKSHGDMTPLLNAWIEALTEGNNND
jgi:hypothetical protein